MKLILIYGPPAVGKLTVSEQLSILTGYNLFHNHLTIDLARALFERNDPEFGNYLEHLRLEAFGLAARKGLLGLIFTYCYAHPEDNSFIYRVIDRVEAHNGVVCFVQLVCNNALLEERVTLENRGRYRKIKSVEKLRQLMNRYDLMTAIPDIPSLQIDNSQKKPIVVAEKIANHYGLL
jgi:hypothetical protein